MNRSAQELDANVERKKFDRAARNYEQLLNESIGASGESADYFRQHKVECLRTHGAQTPLLDFGCGTGGVTRYLVEAFDEVHGVDASLESLSVARRRVDSATFYEHPERIPKGHFRSVLVSGVLHHVPPGQRRAVLRRIWRSLRPGGRIFVFEHNPLNPLTRRAVAQCEFDDDAVLLWPGELRRRLLSAGFETPRVHYVLFFPHSLASLRPLEPKLEWCPAGAQTLTVARRPVSDACDDD